ncbi:hypothetical protein FNV43_RR23248 [Rhamnella rubrinervis]|uniref:Chromatin modification-related protein MEAF6 n=1 Tax=Rhamnella rubrinervis TaxID=2594499 RepID=A0A8K0DWS1_9ROSA|nr:hypothetical protein FNV43_RR23248 [Rhamnella rubrinervis]
MACTSNASWVRSMGLSFIPAGLCHRHVGQTCKEYTKSQLQILLTIESSPHVSVLIGPHGALYPGENELKTSASECPNFCTEFGGGFRVLFENLITWYCSAVDLSIKKMDSEAQKSSLNPSAMLASLLGRRAKLQEDLRNIERQVYDMETSYLQDPSQCGNVLKGFEGFLSSSKNTALLKRSRKFQPEDRLFSLSSVTSPAAEELAAGRDDGRSDFGPGRSKGGGIYANGQGKPKKGRPTPRDAKRLRPSSEDFDYDDDPELTL